MNRTEAEKNKANLHNANLSNANLYNADLRNADLSNANLHNADLYNANLHNADLRNANLHNADLYNADLSNADLSNASLRNADLSNAKIKNTIFVDKPESKIPIQISGLNYHIIIFTDHIKIGCQCFTKQQWVDIDTEDLINIGATDKDLKDWNQYKLSILSL